MAQDFDLTAQKWLNLIFEGKNKEYGAYVLREESSNRHLKSLLIVTLVGLSAIFLPKIITSVLPEQEVVVEQAVEVVMTNIQAEVPEENQIKAMENVPPPPALKESIKMTEIVIDKDENVRDEDLMANAQELTDSKAAISVATVEHGSKDGIDIADLNDHKIVIQEKEPEIHNLVEIMPGFPGGEAELMKWLKDNIKYPPTAAEQGIKGRVVVRFVVRPDGSVDKVEIVRPLDPSLDREALRVVKKMPKWLPGKQNGVAVHVYYTLPINFTLQN